MTPGLQSAQLTGNSAIAYHIELLGAIAAGIKEGNISTNAIKSLVLPYIDGFLISSNESVLGASMHLQIYASERLLVEDQQGKGDTSIKECNTLTFYV